jgi:hypothetical protein
VIATDLFDANCKNMDIAVDARGRVYVVDTVKAAIFVFEPVPVRAKTSQDGPFWPCWPAARSFW